MVTSKYANVEIPIETVDRVPGTTFLMKYF